MMGSVLLRKQEFVRGAFELKHSYGIWKGEGKGRIVVQRESRLYHMLEVSTRWMVAPEPKLW